METMHSNRIWCWNSCYVIAGYEYYSKEAVDKYPTNLKKNIDKVEEMRKFLIPPDEPVTIIYHLGHETVNQFTTNMFGRLRTTGQYTSDCLETNRIFLKTIPWSSVDFTEWTLTTYFINLRVDCENWIHVFTFYSKFVVQP